MHVKDILKFEDSYTSKFTNFNRKKESLLARLLLDNLCLKHTSKNLFNLGFSKGNLGNPFFAKKENLFCSITHSYGWVVVAISSSPIGIDFEKIDLLNSKDLKIAFSTTEWNIYKDSPMDIFRFFSLKESYSKFLGKGFNIEPNKVEVGADVNTFHKFFKTNKLDQFILTVVSQQKLSINFKEIIDLNVDKYLNQLSVNKCK